MPSIVIDASSLVGALLKAESVPETALLLARRHDVICMSSAVEREIREVFARPKFAAATASGRAGYILDILTGAASWCEPTEQVHDCRDAKDNIYLKLAWAARAGVIVASDHDLLVLGSWRGIPVIRPADYVGRFRP